MNRKIDGSKGAADKFVKNIHLKTDCRYSAEEKFLAWLRGEESTAALCRREKIAANL